MDKEWIVNAKISDARIGFTYDGRFFSFQMTCSMDGTGQGFGSYALDKPGKEFGERLGTATGMQIIMDILRALELTWWHELNGKIVRIKRVGDTEFSVMIRAIGHPVKEQWMDIRDYTDAWKLEYPDEENG